MIDVSFLYVHTDGQVFAKSLTLADDATLFDGIAKTGWLHLPEFGAIKAWLDNTDHTTTPNQRAWYVGVWSVKKPLNHILGHGDRVELYRPLADDPMKKRQTKVLIEKKKQARLDSQPRQRRERN